MADTHFPLLRLPETAMHHVLKSMDYIELTSYSLLSRKTKLLIKSLKIQASKIFVGIWKFCLVLQIRFQNLENVEISMFEIKNPNRDTLKLNVETPCNKVSVSTRLFRGPQKWNIQPLNLKGWLDHVSSIFNYCEPPILDFDSEVEVFDTKSIRKAIAEVSGLTIHTRPEYGREILRLFLSDAKCKDICFQCDPFTNEPSVVFQKVGIQNLNAVYFCWFSEIALDDLLMFNFHYIDISNRFLMTVKEINRFIRSWIKGSNHKLKWIQMFFKTLNVATVLRGIPYQVMSESTERTFGAESSKIRSIIKGGFDVRNKKGITANIQIKNYDGARSSIAMYVMN